MNLVAIALSLIVVALSAQAQNVATVRDKEQILRRLVLIKKAKCNLQPFSPEIYKHRENMEFLAAAGLKVTQITVTNGTAGSNMGPRKGPGYRAGYVLEISDAATSEKVTEINFGTCEVYFSCGGDHCVDFSRDLFDGIKE